MLNLTEINMTKIKLTRFAPIALPRGHGGLGRRARIGEDGEMPSRGGGVRGRSSPRYGSLPPSIYSLVKRL